MGKVKKLPSEEKLKQKRKRKRREKYNKNDLIAYFVAKIKEHGNIQEVKKIKCKSSLSASDQ